MTPTNPTPEDGSHLGHFITIEKRLCTMLGRPWAASGFSIETLLDDLEKRGKALEEALRTARIAIKALHGPAQWDIYERCSPEMIQIDRALTPEGE